MATELQSALALHHQIQAGELSALEVLDNTFSTIEKRDPQIQAFNTLTKDLAYQTAETVDQKVKAGEKLPLLAGVPLALKDNINIQGIKTTCSSKILENFVAPFNATVTNKLLQNLIPIVGKTNMDEFAMGSSTENSAFRQTKNPWDLNRVPGGSSGGSAAAVASWQTRLALGSDTGGSVRQPAALCGIVGFKPTYGLVSRYGLVAFASSLDQISPFAGNVEDAAALLQVISGFDPMDSTSLKDTPQIDYLANLNKPIEGLKIGYIKELLDTGLEPDVKAATESAIQTLENLGVKVEPVSLPHIKYAIAAYYIIATAEASSNLARYDGVRYGLRLNDEDKDILNMYLSTRAAGFGDEVKRRIMLGTFSLSAGYYDAYYGKAQKVRQLIRQDFEQAFSQFDVIVCPTSPTTAFKLGEKSSDPVQMYLSDIATIPVNLAGLPGISLPCGFDQQHLPIGLQLIGPHLSEALLLQIAHAFESKSGLKNLHPKALASV
jgi:aspartyl-tRNA(Asn)/glutamyl-tRNA(Gln) amidotransferase subunit A